MDKVEIKPTLILMPQLFLGGAENQFRMLFEYLQPSPVYILAMNRSDKMKSSPYKAKYPGRIFEMHLYNNKIGFLAWIHYFSLLFFYITYFRLKYRVRKIIIIQTYDLLLLPYMRLLGYSIIYSERNTGEHRIRLMYKLINCCDFVCTNSIEAKIFLSQHIVKPVVVINNGVRIPIIDNFRVRRHLPAKILIPARIHPVKNQMLVVKALGAFDYEIHFAGAYHSWDYYYALKRAIRGTKATIVFDDYIDNMLDYYKQFDLVLLPSIKEGTSNVILECMANGIPCIVSDVPMNVRLMHNSRYVFKSDSADALTQCVKLFFGYDNSLIEKDLKDNYEYIKDNYSEETMCQTFKNQLVL